MTEGKLDGEARDYPQRCSKPLEIIGVVFMKLAGWKVEGEIPRRNKVIIIAAPHTTNWDFVFSRLTGTCWPILVRFFY